MRTKTRCTFSSAFLYDRGLFYYVFLELVPSCFLYLDLLPQQLQLDLTTAK